MRNFISFRVAAVMFTLIVAMGLMFTILWRSIFDTMGIILAGLLVGPVLILFTSIEQWYRHHHKG